MNKDKKIDYTAKRSNEELARAWLRSKGLEETEKQIAATIRTFAQDSLRTYCLSHQI